MAKTVTKRKVQMPGSIRQRLSAALCMLLVSSIMLVSTTYAWFTLSTAPEVTGIDTSVAGNGSLEIALMPTDGLLGTISSGRSVTGSGGSTAANVTWGNIVNLSDASYGLGKINLNPAVLNTTENETEGTKLNVDHPLAIATYGYDGRAEKLSDTNIVARSYDNSAFSKSEYGVRAIGETAGIGTEAMTVETTYGYIVDLAVRINTQKETTNEQGEKTATNAKLLLQTDDAQRIYSDSTNADTKGGGSSMSFVDTTGLKMDDLMKAVRVTFVRNLGNGYTDTDGNRAPVEILGTARLDYEAKTQLENGSGSIARLYLIGDNEELIKTKENAVLVDALTKNTAVQISAIVWLDGTAVKNSSVSAAANALAQATLNLQFSTDAELHPASNGELFGETTSDTGPTP